MKRLKFFALAAMAFALFAATQAAANQLANAGFETDAVFGSEPIPGATDWLTFVNASTASADLDPVRTGIGSLQLGGVGGFSVPGAYQTFPANAGEMWDLQGYMLTQDALPANATFGLLKIVWSDGANDLVPGAIIFGQAGPAANPGVEALAHLDSASTPNTWQFTQARGVAPAGTTEVKMFALFVDQSAGTGYFDDLQATLIPAEPDVPGDYNSNGTVDAADYVLWRNGGPLANEVDNPGTVNAQDYTEWRARFGNSVGSGADANGNAVPEPAAMVLLIILAAAGILSRVCRSTQRVPRIR